MEIKLDTIEEAIEKINQHSRNYARKQMTWFKRDKEIKWFDLTNQIDQKTLLEQIIDLTRN